MSSAATTPGSLFYERLRKLADEYEADRITYGEATALDILVNELEVVSRDANALAREVQRSV